MKIKPFLEFYTYFYEIEPTSPARLPVRRAMALSPTLRGAVGNGFIRSAECINAFPTGATGESAATKLPCHSERPRVIAQAGFSCPFGAIHLQVAQRAGRGRAKTFPWGKVDSKSPDSAILKTDEG